jgi:hypothetical protein
MAASQKTNFIFIAIALIIVHRGATRRS